MKKIFRCLASITAVAMLFGSIPFNSFADENVNTRAIVIDGDKANTNENMLYRGAGMVSGNNSSRLLMDYKTESPDEYWEIMEYLFGDEGIGITHLKLEMGSDVNSSSGTEPSVKRDEDEEADVTRGAGYMLAADAKTINPDLTLDMLWWSEPKWITDSEDVYAARYKWYKETLDAAYETYGLKFDYVSVTQNERSCDVEWIKYLANHLNDETDCPYDYSAIKLVGGEEVCTWNFAMRMLKDEELMEAIDVVGSHYTSFSNANAQKLANEYGKELWFSEASSSMEYAQGTYRYDESGSGMANINGILDIANRIIGMYPNGKMTLYEYQPVISAYYDGVTYCQKQLISAQDPWSGYYQLDSGFFMSLHFSQFMKKGWAFVEDASYSDGVAGGDGHAIVDAMYSYMTATDTETDDYSTVITNTTSEPIVYEFTVKNLDKASSQVGVWETRGPDDGDYDENYFKLRESITPTENNGEYTYSVTVAPYSLVTVSTVTPPKTDYENMDESDRAVLELPYSDDFEYSGYAENYLSSRGYAPRYTTDEGGAFEVVNKDGNNVLMQKITPETKAKEWGSTPNPTTNFGDDRWYNYSVSADIMLEKSDDTASNYAGVGLRYNLAANGQSGYWFRVYENGFWEVKANNATEISGVLTDFDSTATHNLKISAEYNIITVYIDNEQIGEFESADEATLSAGRASLYSSYNQNCFDNVKVEALENVDAYITRYDNTDACFSYEGTWDHNTMSSFKNLKRTISTGEEGAVVTVEFDGTGVALTGETKKDAEIIPIVDGVEQTACTTFRTGSREVSYQISGLENGHHTLSIKVVSGTYSVDGMEVIGGEIPFEKEEEVTQPSDDSSNAVDKNTPADKTKTEKKDSVLPVVIGAVAVVAVVAVAVVVVVKRKKK